MLLAMVEDIRVVVIKLAERTQALRYLMNADVDDRRFAAREVRDLFAPLANRLGIWQLKWELEDLSLRALEEVAYKEIARALEARRVDRERDIDDVVAHTLARTRDCGHRGRIERPAQAHLQHLEQDAPQGSRHRRALRHPRRARAHRRRRRLLHDARHRSPSLDADPG